MPKDIQNKSYSLDRRGKLHRPDGRFASKQETIAYFSAMFILLGAIIFIFSALVAVIALILWIIITAMAFVIRLGTGKQYLPQDIDAAIRIVEEQQHKVADEWHQFADQIVSDQEINDAERVLNTIRQRIDDLHSYPFHKACRAFRINRLRNWLARQFDLDQLEWYYASPLIALPWGIAIALCSLIISGSFQIMCIALMTVWLIMSIRYARWLRFADSGGPWAKTGNLGTWLKRRQDAITAEEKIELTALDHLSQLRFLRDLAQSDFQLRELLQELANLKSNGIQTIKHHSIQHDFDAIEPSFERVNTLAVVSFWVSLAVVLTAMLLNFAKHPNFAIYLIWHFTIPLLLLYLCSKRCERCNARWALDHARQTVRKKSLVCYRCGKVVDDVRM